MAITNGYCTLAELQGATGVNDNDDRIEMEASIESASRMVDDHCGKGRKFWQDATVVARTYYPTEARRVYVDDISTTTGLVVKVDIDDDGTFETTLTINTDFIVEPVNAGAEFPVRPYESIRLLDGTITAFQRLSSGRPFVQVTAKYGWSAVPDSVQRATLLQARNAWKAAQTQDALLQVSIDGQVIRTPILHPMARVMLESFVRFAPVDDCG